MIDRCGSDISLVCDATGKRYPRTYDNCEFMTMLADAKGDGWQIFQKDGEWRHFSPDSNSTESEFETFEE